MSVSLITQRAKAARSKKQQGVIETLDIVVETNGFSRPYSMFSGGEKMLLNLACRIGLSRLVVARAGAEIRFLIIDEGWGTLDEANRSAFLSALSSLTDSFDLIATVTHVPSVAEAFPSRLEVSKGPFGSEASLKHLAF